MPLLGMCAINERRAGDGTPSIAAATEGRKFKLTRPSPPNWRGRKFKLTPPSPPWGTGAGGSSPHFSPRVWKGGASVPPLQGLSDYSCVPCPAQSVSRRMKCFCSSGDYFTASKRRMRHPPIPFPLLPDLIVRFQRRLSGLLRQRLAFRFGLEARKARGKARSGNGGCAETQ